MKNSHNNAKEINEALLNAAEDGHVEVVRELLAACADINIVDNDFGYTALMSAAKNGHVEVVRELLAAGADINVVDNDFGHTALMWAALNGHVEVVRELLAAGANPNAIDIFCRSVLMYAVKGGNDNVVELLLLSGAQLPNRRMPNIINNAIRGIYHSFRMLQAYDLRDTFRNFINHVDVANIAMNYVVPEELARHFYDNSPIPPGLARLLRVAEDLEQENGLNNN